jgi:hypothetical protein
MANYLIGSAGVTVDGSTTKDTFEVITGASAVTVNALGGDDTIKLSAFNPSDSLYKLSDGEDAFTISTANATGMDFQSSTIRGGEGEDTISIGIASSEINNMEIRGNEGNDTLNLDLTALDGTASSINLQGNAGNDTINVAADDAVYNITIGGGKGADDITYVGGTFNDSTLIGGFGTDTATADMDVNSSLIQLGNGTNDATDSADTLIYSGAIANSTVKGGAGNDTITMALKDNSTALIVEGNIGADTLNISANGDYESTKFQLGAGNDTINLSGDGVLAVSADIIGGAGNDDINFDEVSGLVVEGGLGADDIEYSGATVYKMAFGDSIEAGFDQIEAAAIATGGTVIYEFNGEDLTIQSSETVTAVVGTTTSEMNFTGGNIYFGADAAVTDVTAAVDYLEAGLANDEAATFTLATSDVDHLATDEFYLFVKGAAGEASILVEMTDLGVGAGAATGGMVLTVADTFSASTLTFTV